MTVSTELRRIKSLVLSRTAAIGVTLVLLAGAATQRLLGPSRVDALPYLERIRQTYATVPLRFGDWVGVEQTVPTSAVAMLRPNVLFSRGFTDLSNGRQAGFLFVDCGDARDLAGHYPPICYVSSGWVLSDARRRDWHVRDWTIHGSEYEFTTPPFRGRQSLTVMNAMVMPDGQFYPDIDSIRHAAARLTRRYWGAAQIQVIVDASMPQETRDEIFNSLVTAHADLIASVLNSSPTNPQALAAIPEREKTEIIK